MIVALAAAFAFLPGPLFDRLRILTAGVCSLRADHSFAADGLALPLCARDTGIYVGLGIAFLGQRIFFGDRAFSFRSRLTWGLIAAATLIIGVDGANSVLADLGLPSLYEPSNALRLASGMPWGASLGLLFALQTSVIVGQSRQQSSSGTPFRAWLLPLVLVLAFGAIVTGSGPALDAAAAVSVLGLMVAWTTVSRWVLATLFPLLSGLAAWTSSVTLGTLALITLSALRYWIAPV